MIRHLILGLAAAALVPAMALAHAQPPAAAGSGQDAAYTGSDPWAGAPQDLTAREQWLDRKIHTAMTDGTLDPDQGRVALKDLHAVARMDATQHMADVQSRLDDVNARVAKAISHHEVRSY